jgi:hypothetical protein
VYDSCKHTTLIKVSGKLANCCLGTHVISICMCDLLPTAALVKMSGKDQEDQIIPISQLDPQLFSTVPKLKASAVQSWYLAQHPGGWSVCVRGEIRVQPCTGREGVTTHGGVCESSGVGLVGSHAQAGGGGGGRPGRAAPPPRPPPPPPPPPQHIEGLGWKEHMLQPWTHSSADEKGGLITGQHHAAGSITSRGDPIGQGTQGGRWMGPAALLI